MAAFEYIALDARGRQQKGVLEGDSARQVRQLLRDKQLSPLQVEPVQRKEEGASGGFTLRRGLSARDLALVTRQLATLISAALPIEEALRAAAAQSRQPRLQSMLLAVRAKVLEGHSLAKALATYPAAFPELYRATVAAGEHAGHLGPVLEQLADYTEQRQQSRQKIQMALLYPVILMLASLGIVGFLLGYVVPDVVRVFVDSGQTLPALTRGLIFLSELVKAWGALAIVPMGTAEGLQGDMRARCGSENAAFINGEGALIVALKGAVPELREKFLSNMSSRAADALREDLESRGPMRLSEVEAQQKEILKTVRRLSDEGQIVIGGGGDDAFV